MTPPFASRISADVNEALRGFLAEQRRSLEDIAPELRYLVDTLGEFLEGGKHLRPQFVYAGALAANPTLWNEEGEIGSSSAAAPRGTLAQIAAAVELVQAAALIHDDLIDHSPTRRGRPAVHVAAARRHSTSGFAGSAHDFGDSTAVILGDLTLSWAEQLASRALTGADDRKHFDALRSEVMAGQYLDILNQAEALVSPGSAEASALSVIRWKTVSYTVLRPLLIGASHSNASPELLSALQRLAEPLGTAFQLRDDLLGVFGDEEKTGKPAGGDITEGKRTALLGFAYEHANPSQRRALDAAVGVPDASARRVEQARQAIVETGARAHIEAMVDRHASAALASIDTGLTRVAGPQAVNQLKALTILATGFNPGEGCGARAAQ